MKGVLYAAVGFLALKYALGLGGKTANPKATISEISRQPFGKIHLIIIALGLASYAIWRWVDGIANVENYKHNLKGWFQRVFCLSSGAVYAGLAVWTVMYFFGQSSTSGSESADGKYLMGHVWGRSFIGVLGLFYLGLGIEHFREVLMKDYQSEIDDYKIDRNKKNIASIVAAVGLSARGVVFLIIGWFICKATIFYDSSEHIGLNGALDKLLEHRYGR